MVSYPAYNPTDTYTFIVDINVSDPSKLYFGVGDSFYPDDTGSLTLHLTQLQELSSVPEPSALLAGTMLLLPFGASTLRKWRESRFA